MKKQLLQVLLPCLCLLAVSCVFVLKSTHDQQKDAHNHSVVKVDPEFVEIPPDVEGRTPALDFFIDDPRFIEEIVRKLDLHDDTGFSHLSEIHPILRR